MNYDNFMMMKLIFAILFSITCSHIFAQHELVDSKQFLLLSNDSTIQKLDVRTGVEFEMVGHIPGFVHVNVESSHFRDSVLCHFDPKKAILVTCFSGHRSTKAVEELLQMGFTRIYELKGGIIAWLNAGNQLE